MINKIWKQVALVLFYGFWFLLDSRITWSERIHTSVWICCVKYFNPNCHKCINGLHILVASYRICFVQCPTMARKIRNFNIISRGFQVERQSYSILLNPRRRLFTLLGVQSSFYTVTLQSTTMGLKAVYDIADQFVCEKKISWKLVGATKSRLNFDSQILHSPLWNWAKTLNYRSGMNQDQTL